MASVYVCEYFMCISSGVLITEYIWLGIIFEHVKFGVNRFTKFCSSCNRHFISERMHTTKLRRNINVFVNTCVSR